MASATKTRRDLTASQMKSPEVAKNFGVFFLILQFLADRQRLREVPTSAVVFSEVREHVADRTQALPFTFAILVCYVNVQHLLVQRQCLVILFDMLVHLTNAPQTVCLALAVTNFEAQIERLLMVLQSA